MKRFVSLLLLLPSLSYCGVSYANDSVDTSAGKQDQVSSADLKKDQDRRKKIEEKRAQLEATQWEVSLVPRSPKLKPEKDTFIFQNGEFRTENRSKRGFNPTNYTVSIVEGDENSAVFETMQGSKEGYAFIKGQWAKDSMHGEIIEQLDGGKLVKEYYFSNAKMAKMAGDGESEKTSSEDGGFGKALVSTEKSKSQSKQSSSDTAADPVSF